MSGVLMRVYNRLPAPARSVAATLRGWYLRAWRYGPATQRLVAEAQERERWSAERWQAWQAERLGYVLHRAATRVPYYREQWAARRRQGDHASWELLENWPILEKDAVREQPRAFVADDRDVRHMFREQTSGTTGKPLVVWRSRHTIEQLYALSAARTRLWHGVTRSDRWAMLGGQLVIPVGQRRPPFWVWNAALRQLYLSSYHLAPDLISHYLDALARYRIVYLYGYASSMAALAEGVLRLGRGDLKLRVAITNSEALFPHQRERIAAAFQCPVRETYGMGETVAAASECGGGTLHQWPEVGIIELMADGHPAAGAGGELVGTGLLNDDMPLIRYRVGDSGRLAHPGAGCACGRTLPVIAGLDGRTNDLLVTRDGRRVYWLNPVFYGLPVREAQIVQERLDRLRVRYVPTLGFSVNAAGEIVSRLRARMGAVEVELEEVAAVPRSAAGKLRAVVSELSPDETATALTGQPLATAAATPRPAPAAPASRRRILVLDAHTLQALACVRSLARAGHTVLVASHRRAALAAWSRYTRRRFQLRGETLLAFAELRAWARRHEVDLVLPVTERSCLLCAAERVEWEAAGIVVGCAPQDVLLRAFDKAQTFAHAAACGVTVPPTRVPDSLEAARVATQEVGFPCVVKQRFSNAFDGTAFLPDRGTAYVRTLAQVDAAILERRQGEHWPLVQGWVPGQGKGVFALCDHGRAVAWFAHERLRDVRPSGSGSSLRRATALDERLRAPAERLLQALHWHGPAMVEFRDDGVTPPQLMEVNGRFWGSLQLAIAAGVDFPALWVRLLGGEPVPPPARYAVGLTMRWLWGDVKRLLFILRGAEPGYPEAYPTLRQGLREVLGPQPEGTRWEIWDPRDPWPAFAAWLRGVAEVFGRV